MDDQTRNFEQVHQQELERIPVVVATAIIDEVVAGAIQMLSARMSPGNTAEEAVKLAEEDWKSIGKARPRNKSSPWNSQNQEWLHHLVHQQSL